jgi:MATE family multidrug resistance protein
MNSYHVSVQVFTFCVHWINCIIFVQYLEMRETGVAIASSITFILNMILVEIIFRYNSETLFKDLIQPIFMKECWKDFNEHLSIGIPAMFMLCFEMWALEILAIFSGLIGVDNQAAEVCIINLITFIFMVPLGISISAASLVGTNIGKGRISLAKKYAFTCMIFGIVTMAAIVAIIITFADQVSKFYTEEKNVSRIFKSTLMSLMCYIFTDAIHGVASGIIRGIGKQGWGSIVTLVSYYLIGMPMALYFCFNLDMKLNGLWIGFDIAQIFLDTGLILVVVLPSWEKIHEESKAKLDAQSELSDSSQESELVVLDGPQKRRGQKINDFI